MTDNIQEVKDAVQVFQDGAKAFEAYKTETAPKLKKLDSLDMEALKRQEKAIGDAMELGQTLDARAKALEEEKKASNARLESMEEKQKLLEAALNRPVTASTPEEKQAEVRQKANKLFNDFARVNSTRETDLAEYVKENVSAEDRELKALTVNSDPNGGYLTFPEFGGIISTYVYETSPMRQLADVVTVGTDALEFVTDNDQAGWGWVGETQARPDTYTPQLGKLLINVNEMYAMPPVSQKMLDDAAIDVEAWIGNKVAQVFGRGEAAAFVSGNGINKPLGILSYPAGTNIGSGQVQQVGSGNASGFTYGGLVLLQNSLKEEYQGNATFLMQRATLGSLLQLSETQGRPIFNQTYDKNTGLESMILGKPVRFAADMPAVATNALAIAYGDFKQAYLIVDRMGIRVLRDPYTNKPFIRFYTTKRVGGAVVNSEAYKLLKVSA